MDPGTQTPAPPAMIPTALATVAVEVWAQTMIPQTLMAQETQAPELQEMIPTAHLTVAVEDSAQTTIPRTPMAQETRPPAPQAMIPTARPTRAALVVSIPHPTTTAQSPPAQTTTHLDLLAAITLPQTHTALPTVLVEV